MMNGNYDDDTGELIAKITDKDTEIKRLETEVEALKCCGNCKYFMMDDCHVLYCENEVYPFLIFGKCDKWEGRK
jgi:hypothetical protein